MSSTADHPARSGKWLTQSGTLVLTLLFTAMIGSLYGFGVYLFSMVLPDMKAEIVFDYTGAGWITGLSHLGFLFGSLVAAKLAARFGGARLLLCAVMLAASSLLALALVNSGWLICLLLGLIRLSQALAWIPLTGLAASHVNPRRRSMVLAVACSGATYIIFLNGVMVPYLLTAYGWRSVWLVSGGLTLAAALAAWPSFKRLGMMRKTAPQPASMAAPAPAQIPGLKSLILKHKLILSLFLLSGLGYWPYSIYLSPYIRDELGLGLEFAQELWSVIGLAGLAGGLLIGFVSDRLGLRIGLSVVYLATITSGIVMCFPQYSGLFPISAAGYGMSVAVIFGLHPAYLSKTASAAEADRVTGLGCTLLGIAAIVSSYLGGWSKGVSGTFSWLFLYTAGIALLALLITWRLPAEDS